MGGISTKRTLQRFEEKFKKCSTGCWKWTAGVMGTQNRGCFYYNGQMRPAPRIAHILYIGPIPDGLYVCHTCDNPMCVNPAHLWLGTQKDNMQDMIKKGRDYDKRGEGNPRCLLTPKMVLAIRADPRSSLQLGKDKIYPVVSGTMRAIRQKRIWAHI